MFILVYRFGRFIAPERFGPFPTKSAALRWAPFYATPKDRVIVTPKA